MRASSMKSVQVVLRTPRIASLAGVLGLRGSALAGLPSPREAGEPPKLVPSAALQSPAAGRALGWRLAIAAMLGRPRVPCGHAGTPSGLRVAWIADSAVAPNCRRCRQPGPPSAAIRPARRWQAGGGLVPRTPSIARRMAVPRTAMYRSRTLSF